LLISAPLAAQTSSPTDPQAMSGMNRDGMGHSPAAEPAAAMPAMDHGKMQMMDHGGMDGMEAMMKNTPANPYADAGMIMHHKMMVVGADASETWARQMIEHHRGAIAMAKIAVAQAKDKEIRAMAEEVITMQEQDVASLQSWLKRHGKAAQ